MGHRAHIANASFSQDDGRTFVSKDIQAHKVLVERDGCCTDLVSCFRHQPVAGIVELRCRRIEGVADVDHGPSTAVGCRGQAGDKAFHFVMQFKLQTGRVGEARRRGVHPNLHRRVESGDGPFRNHIEAVRTGAGIGVRLHTRRANGVVALEFEIDDQADVVSRVKPSVVSHFGAIPSVAFRDAFAVVGGHLVRFVTSSVIDGLAEVIRWLSNIGDHPRGRVGVGLGWREWGDVIALARPLRG